jgi:dolichol kinase
MSETLCLDAAARLAYELHDFIREIDAVRWRREMEAALGRRLVALERRLASVIEASADATVELRPHVSRLAELASVLREHTPQAALSGRAARQQWRRLRLRLLPAYESYASGLRGEAVPIPQLRPTNPARIALHVGGMATALIALQLLPSAALIAAAGVAAAICWTLELLRRRSERINTALMAFFRGVAHPLEARRVNSSTWFVTALFALSWLDSALVGGAAVIVLGVGDPIAGLIGRRWGRLRVLNNRTLEGSIAFAASSFAAVCAFLALRDHALSSLSILATAGAAAVAGAAAEMLSRRVDDNFVIPLSAAASAGLALWISGAPLG